MYRQLSSWCEDSHYIKGWLCVSVESEVADKMAQSLYVIGICGLCALVGCICNRKFLGDWEARFIYILSTRAGCCSPMSINMTPHQSLRSTFECWGCYLWGLPQPSIVGKLLKSIARAQRSDSDHKMPNLLPTMTLAASHVSSRSIEGEWSIHDRCSWHLLLVDMLKSMLWLGSCISQVGHLFQVKPYTWERIEMRGWTWMREVDVDWSRYKFFGLCLPFSHSIRTRHCQSTFALPPR